MAEHTKTETKKVAESFFHEVNTELQRVMMRELESGKQKEKDESNCAPVVKQSAGWSHTKWWVAGLLAATVGSAAISAIVTKMVSSPAKCDIDIPGMPPGNITIPSDLDAVASDVLQVVGDGSNSRRNLQTYSCRTERGLKVCIFSPLKVISDWQGQHDKCYDDSIWVTYFSQRVMARSIELHVKWFEDILTPRFGPTRCAVVGPASNSKADLTEGRTCRTGYRNIIKYIGSFDARMVCLYAAPRSTSIISGVSTSTAISILDSQISNTWDRIDRIVDDF